MNDGAGSPMILLSLLLAASELSFADSSPIRERPDLLPQPGRWQTYPSDVERVVVDRRGRPWFEVRDARPFEKIESKDAIQQIKSQVERVASLQAPWLFGAQILLFDRQDRVWLLPRQDRRVLLGYSLRTGQWTERHGLPQEPAGSEISTPYIVTGPAFESRDGRLYFGDRIGVQVLEGETWTHQHLYLRNLQEDLFYDARPGTFGEPEFAEDGKGRVYLWTGWGKFGWTGTVGFFVHEKSGWRQVTRGGGQGFDRVAAVVPLKGKVLVCTQEGPAFLIATDPVEGDGSVATVADVWRLGHAAHQEREAAQQRLEKRGTDILPILTKTLYNENDPEIRMRLSELVDKLDRVRIDKPLVDGRAFHYARCFGRDAAGNALVWADRMDDIRNWIGQVSPEGKVSRFPSKMPDRHPVSSFLDSRGRVWFGCYGRGCIVSDGDKVIPITDETDSSFLYLLGEDRRGRVFLSNGDLVVACDLAAPENRAGLPTEFFELPRGGPLACLSSNGEVWARLADKESPFISVYRGKRWEAVRLAKDERIGDRLTYLHSLDKGQLVAQAGLEQTAFFYDGKLWTSYPSLRRLVEVHYGDISRNIDNRRVNSDSYAKLRVDSQTNIWVYESQKCGVFDGQRWIEVADRLRDQRMKLDMINHCLPTPGRQQMIMGDRYFTYRVGIEKGEVRAAPMSFKWPSVGSFDLMHAWLDSRERIWVWLGESCAGRIEDGRATVLNDTGLPRLEDSEGAIWFLNLKTQQIVALSLEGKRAELSADSLLASSRMVEDRPGSVWITTERGLLNVLKQRDGNLLKVRHYEHRVPKGECWGLWVDRDRNLWFLGRGAARNGLYRVELPVAQ